MNRLRMNRIRSTLLCAGLSLLLGTSVMAQQAATGEAADASIQVSEFDKLDPWQSWNRRMFRFNEGFDEAILVPAARTYVEVLPSGVRRAIDNVFGNVADAWSAVNLLLQGRLKPAMEQTMRVTFNSTFGFGGLIDLAGAAGIERTPSDLGLTFGAWGFSSGNFIVWPIFGASSVRDSIALPFNRYVSPALFFTNFGAQIGVSAVQLVNFRSGLLKAREVADGVALDKYIFYRDGYLQNRAVVREDDDYEVVSPEPPAVKPPAEPQ